MKSLDQHLRHYAAYHQDRRNVLTHFAGIPLIVLAVVTLLSRPSLAGLSPALLVAAASVVFYLKLDKRYGMAMAAALALCLWLGHWLAGLGTSAWLGWGVGLFVVGWVLQLIGHGFEGRKPAFVDDVVGLLVGPLFIVAELGFLLGWRLEVRQRLGV